MAPPSAAGRWWPASRRWCCGKSPTRLFWRMCARWATTSTRRCTIVNYLLLAANIAMFVYELSLGVRGLDRFIGTWGVRSTDVIALLGGHVRLLAPVLLAALVSMFLHGGWLHIFFNMLFLWVF